MVKAKKMDGSSAPRKHTYAIRREYLKQLRRSRGISAPKMAEMLGLSCRQHYLRYENGERNFVGIAARRRYMCAFAQILSMPYSYFEQGELDYIRAKEEMNRILASQKKKPDNNSQSKSKEDSSNGQ